VDVHGATGRWVSIAASPSGVAHIAYKNFGPNTLRHAVRSGGGFTLETVDATGDVAGSTAIAVDASGNPHIAYTDDANGNLKYARFTGASWMLESVDASPAYHDRTNTSLKYAVRAGGTWRNETVDDSGNVGQQPTIAIGAGDLIHIIYQDADGSQIMHSTSRVGGWSTNRAIGTTAVYPFLGMTLDAAGNPGFAYRTSAGEVHFVRQTGGTWREESVDATADVGWQLRAAADPAGNAHLVHYDLTNGDLRHATQSGASWALEIIDSAGSVGSHPAIAIDPAGRIHVAYLDGTRGMLKYATR
jgi:hypothetical protein